MNTANETFEGLNFIRVDELSKIPKYMQIVEIIKSDIENGIFGIGEQVPSINETSAEFDMARDTVEKAYKILKEKGILSAVKGKGYYVASSGRLCSKRGLMLLNEFDDEIKEFYLALVKQMPENSEIDVLLYNGDTDQLERNIISNIGHYDYFLISTRCTQISESLTKAISLIPNQKRLFIQSKLKEFPNSSAIGYNCKNQFRQVFSSLSAEIAKYRRFALICPDKSYYQNINEVFADYCREKEVSCSVHSNPAELKVQKGDLFLIQDDSDLIRIIKKSKDADLEIGRDVGVICLMDSSVKEVLLGGITVIKHDYASYAESASGFLLAKQDFESECTLKVVRRASF